MQIGDKVCYSKKFLQSIGAYSGDIPLARGTITNLVQLGAMTLADIDWNDPEMSPKVNICNLSKITNKGIEELN
jgi:hypothetical protein